MPQSIVQTYRDISKRSGLVLSLAIDISMALHELYLRLYPDDERVAMLLDIGSVTSTVVVVKGEEMRYARQIKASPITQPDGWTNELVRSLEFYSNEPHAAQPELILLSGGGSLHPGLAQQIAEHTTLPAVSLFSERAALDKGFRQIMEDHGTKLALFAPVLGLAMMRSPEHTTADLEKSMPGARMNGKENIARRLATDKTTRQWFSWISTVLIVLLLFAVLVFGRTIQLKRSIKEQRVHYAQIEAAATSANMLVASLREADLMLTQLEQDKKVVGLFIPITDSMPGIQITAIRYRPTIQLAAQPEVQKIYIEGRADNETALKLYIQQLHKQPLVKEIEETPAHIESGKVFFRCTLLLHGVS